MNPVYRITRQVIGWFFILLGVIGMIIPVLPQLPFLALGALLLAPYVRIFRRLSAWIHKKYPKWRGPMRHFREFKRAPPGARPNPNGDSR